MKSSFKVRTPLKQFMDWMDGYYRDEGRLPIVCYMAPSDLNEIIKSIPSMPMYQRTDGKTDTTLMGVIIVTTSEEIK